MVYLIFICSYTQRFISYNTYYSNDYSITKLLQREFFNVVRVKARLSIKLVFMSVL